MLKKLNEFFSKLGTDYQQARTEKRNVMLDRQSCSTINVMEFDGELFLSYNGVPVINTEYLNASIVDVLDNSRDCYLAWKKKFDRNDA